MDDKMSSCTVSDNLEQKRTKIEAEFCKLHGREWLRVQGWRKPEYCFLQSAVVMKCLLHLIHGDNKSYVDFRYDCILQNEICS